MRISLYRTKGSPYWWCNWTIDGRRVRRSTGVAGTGASKPEARRVAEGLCREAVRANLKPGARITLDAAAGRYLLEVIRHHANAKDEETALDRIVGRLGRERFVSDIGDGEIAGLVARRRGDNRWGKSEHGRVGNRAVNADTKLLRALVNRVELWGFEHGGNRRWARHILPEADERIAELTYDQEDRLWDALTKDRPDLIPMVSFALASGMRLGNVIGLEWSQIDWDSEVITYRAKSQKPGKAIRRLPLTPELIAILQGEMGRHTERVFTFVSQRTANGKSKGSRYPLTATGWRRGWLAALSTCGLPDFHFHDLRHTLATRALRATGNLKAVQHALGHARIETTAKYAHVLDSDVRNALAGAGRQRLRTVKEG